MPLSEHEQRQLEQIEQALLAEHPRFARAVHSSDPRVHYRRRVLQATIGFFIGVGLLVAGVAVKEPWMGVAGFVVMLLCSMWALTSYRHMNGVTTGRSLARERRPGAKPGRPGRPGKGARTARPPMMERFEERWRRRQERGDR